MSADQISGQATDRSLAGWQLCELGELCRPRQWPTISQEVLLPSGYPVFGANGQIGFYSSFTHEEPTVAVTCRGATCGRVHVTPARCYITGNAMALDTLDTRNVLSSYLAIALQYRGLNDCITGSAQPQIIGAAIRKVRLYLPPLPEQRQIAAVLDTIDDAIRKTEQTIAKLKQVKRGLLHDLLTRGVDDNGELRDPECHPEQFKDSPLGRIPRGWTAVELGQLVDPARPIVYGILMPGTGHQGGVPVVKVRDIKDGQIALDGLLLTSPSIDHEYRRSRLKPGDLLFTIRGTVGRMAVVPAQLDQANITQDTARIGLVRGNPHVVREYLNMPEPRAFIEMHTIGVAVRGINLRDLRRVTIAEPPRKESDEIALRLQSGSARLQAEVDEVAKLRLLKAGIMEDLLTGRVRVTKLLKDAAE